MTTEQLSRIFNGKTVLISGGGGTIGCEISRQVAEHKPVRLVCLGRRAENLTAVQDELRDRTPGVEVATEVCDVCDRDRLAAVFATYHPAIVFHTAAIKDISDAADHPEDAVMVNVQGTVNLVELSLENDTEKLLFVSSTKALRPASVMGATKRLGEMIVAAAAERAEKAFFTVRLSNVLESSGGVHALFRRQIESGGPVTVTHPDAERTFVTATETVGLLLEALTLGQKGDIMALVAGKKTKILDLAQLLIRSYGLQANRDVDIEFVGLRCGERLVEDTVLEGREWLRTSHENIIVSGLEGASASGAGLEKSIRELLLIAKCGQPGAVLEQLRKMVPSCQFE